MTLGIVEINTECIIPILFLHKNTSTYIFTWAGKQDRSPCHSTLKDTKIFSSTPFQECNFVSLLQSTKTKSCKLCTILALFCGFKSSQPPTYSFLETNFSNYIVQKSAVVLSVLHNRMHKHSSSPICLDKVGLFFRPALKGEKEWIILGRFSPSGLSPNSVRILLQPPHPKYSFTLSEE